MFVLVVYAYYETVASRTNLEFFVNRGLLPAKNGDHVVVVNGAHSVEWESLLGDRKNVAVIERENSCMDFGAWGVGLRSVELAKYSHVVLMNGSARGPFLPAFERRPWWHVFLDELGGPHNVGLVGTSLNCWSSLSETHLQSMVLATTTAAASDILLAGTLLDCKRDHSAAVFEGEIPTSQAFLLRNYSLKTMLLAFQSTHPPGGIVTPRAARAEGRDGAALFTLCRRLLDTNAHGGDLYYPNEYGGVDIHPLETVFFKTSRRVSQPHLDFYTRLLSDSHPEFLPGETNNAPQVAADELR